MSGTIAGKYAHRGLALVRENRAPNANFDVYEGASNEDIYVDGFDLMSVGPAIVKIDMVRILKSGMTEIPNEDRELVYRLIVPTAAIVEMAVSVLTSMAANAPLVENALKAQIKQIETALVRVRDAKIATAN